MPARPNHIGTLRDILSGTHFMIFTHRHHVRYNSDEANVMVKVRPEPSLSILRRQSFITYLHDYVPMHLPALICHFISVYYSIYNGFMRALSH